MIVSQNCHPQPKDILFTIIENKEKHQKFSCKKLEEVHFCHYCFKNYKFSIKILTK